LENVDRYKRLCKTVDVDFCFNKVYDDDDDDDDDINLFVSFLLCSVLR